MQAQTPISELDLLNKPVEERLEVCQAQLGQLSELLKYYKEHHPKTWKKSNETTDVWYTMHQWALVLANVHESLEAHPPEGHQWDAWPEELARLLTLTRNLLADGKISDEDARHATRWFSLVCSRYFMDKQRLLLKVEEKMEACKSRCSTL